MHASISACASALISAAIRRRALPLVQRDDLDQTIPTLSAFLPTQRRPTEIPIRKELPSRTTHLRGPCLRPFQLPVKLVAPGRVRGRSGARPPRLASLPAQPRGEQETRLHCLALRGGALEGWGWRGGKGKGEWRGMCERLAVRRQIVAKVKGGDMMPLPCCAAEQHSPGYALGAWKSITSRSLACAPAGLR